MSDNAVAATPETTPSAAPTAGVDAILETEALSDAERAYFESGGTKTDGLFKAADPAPAVAEEKTVSEPVKSEDAVEGEITIDEQGNHRDKKSGRFVPHGVFHATRERAKAAESELAQLREKFTRADERLAVLSDAMSGKIPTTEKKEAEDDKDIDPAQDVFGALAQTQRRLAALQKQIEDSKAEANVRHARATVRDVYRETQETFAKANPAYHDAKSHLIASYKAELEAMGVPAEQRQLLIDKKEAELVLSAIREKQNPADIIFRLAKARGFVEKAAKVETPAADKLATVEKGIAASASLRDAPGGATNGLTREALADMSDDEFAATVSRLGGMSKLQRMLGGM